MSRTSMVGNARAISRMGRGGEMGLLCSSSLGCSRLISADSNDEYELKGIVKRPNYLVMSSCSSS